ncbi:MAG: hypothetical protein ACYCS1_02770 [Gammaproteobacteria bacterium]
MVVPPTVTGLANVSAAVGQSVPAVGFTIAGTGALTVSAASSNPTLLPDSGLSLASGCDTNGAACILSITPALGQVGTAAVTVTVQDIYGQSPASSFVLTVTAVPPPSSSSGGRGALDPGSLLGLLLVLLWERRRSPRLKVG